MPDELKGEMPTQPTPASATPPEAPQATSAAEILAELEKTRAALKNANKEAAERRKRLEELEAVESKRKESEMSELDKLTKRLQDTEAKLKAKERADLQREIARKVGLPEAFAPRLAGETPEDLEADAKALLEALPKPSPQKPNLSPTNPGGGQQGETLEQARARIYGLQANPFDPTFASKKGGGVFITGDSQNT